MEIRFGTDGWRAVIGDEFTFSNVRLVAQAHCDYLKHSGLARRGLVVGYDTRFLSDRFAREVARVAAANGIPVHMAERYAPTPAVSWAVREHGAAGGVMVTASHNPAEYNGYKVKADYAGSALPAITRAIEEQLVANEREGRSPRVIDYHAAVSGGGIRLFAPWPAYERQLRGLVDLERLGRSGFRVAVDVMYGAAQGYLGALLAGAGVDVIEVRGEINPAFPGINPEPIPRNLGALVDAVCGSGAHAGLAVDGDGDRIGAVDEEGRFVDSQRIFALILRHLVEERGWRGTVAATFAVTRMVDKLAARYGLTLHRLPVGFKHVCELALREDVLIGGEESGGIGIKNHIPERDGILCALLLLEIMATRGKTLGQLVDDLLAFVGPHHFQRVDLHLSPERKENLSRELANGVKSFGGLPVTAVDSLDGYKFFLGDRGWILIRPSGTEPVVRVYAELDDPALLGRVLRDGERLAHGTD